MMDAQELAQKIDHTNVGRDATWNDIEKLCDEAELYGFRNVCVTPTQTARASKFLENSSVGVCTVIGFPFGVQTLYSKAFEVKDAIDNGANELDMVLNVGALHSGDDNLVYRDIRGVVLAAGGKVVKVIFE
ncbi:MAG TPA: deoxyribose-phosphate aldolase, partial [Methanobacteriaceae archaeon]|nr:deoxyribose-phosphate aldolase [Methanobacteriaceae archaeon]